MPKVKVIVTDTTTFGFTPAKGYTAEKVASLLRQGKLEVEGTTFILAEGCTVVATITTVQTGAKRTVEMV